MPWSGLLPAVGSGTTMGRQCSATGNERARLPPHYTRPACAPAACHHPAASHVPHTLDAALHARVGARLPTHCTPAGTMESNQHESERDAVFAATQRGSLAPPTALALPLSMKPHHPLPPGAAHSKTSPPRPAAHDGHTSNNHQGAGAPCASAHSSSSWCSKSMAPATTCRSQGQGGSWARSHCSTPR